MVSGFFRCITLLTVQDNIDVWFVYCEQLGSEHSCLLSYVWYQKYLSSEDTVQLKYIIWTMLLSEDKTVGWFVVLAAST